GVLLVLRLAGRAQRQGGAGIDDRGAGLLGGVDDGLGGAGELALPLVHREVDAKDDQVHVLERGRQRGLIEQIALERVYAARIEEPLGGLLRVADQDADRFAAADEFKGDGAADASGCAENEGGVHVAGKIAGREKTNRKFNRQSTKFWPRRLQRDKNRQTKRR